MPKSNKRNDPESPGKVIPLTLITPQKKTKNNPSFSVRGLDNIIVRPMTSPITKKRIVLNFHLSIS